MDGMDILYALVEPLLLWFAFLPAAILGAAYLIFIVVASYREWKKNNRKRGR